MLSLEGWVRVSKGNGGGGTGEQRAGAWKGTAQPGWGLRAAQLSYRTKGGQERGTLGDALGPVSGRPEHQAEQLIVYPVDIGV